MSALQGRVLLLNKSWMPITTVTVKRALKLLFGDVARVVDHRDYSTYDFDSWADLGEIFDEGDFILTSRLKIPIPDVLVLDDFNSVPTQRVTFTRKHLYKRDMLTCQYCGKKPKSKELTIDHIVPRCRGGKSEWTNCVLACLKCNHKKSDKTVKEAGLQLRCKPIEPPRQRMLMALGGKHRISWEKFLTTPKARDKVASEVYWNSELVD